MKIIKIFMRSYFYKFDIYIMKINLMREVL